jgi:hypothetical protein
LDSVRGRRIGGTLQSLALWVGGILCAAAVQRALAGLGPEDGKNDRGFGVNWGGRGADSAARTQLVLAA